MAAVTALRNLSLGVSDLETSVRFFTETWGLEEVARTGGAVYFRGTGTYHHILALRESDTEKVLSADFLADSRADVDAIHGQVVAAGVACAAPAKIVTPGGGYGFTFEDLDGRVVRAIAEDERYAAIDGQPDRPSRIMHVVLMRLTKMRRPRSIARRLASPSATTSKSAPFSSATKITTRWHFSVPTRPR
jgi:catechol 2,3-dioxygenase-like lactoylglutathione lyase family enzyme